MLLEDLEKIGEYMTKNKTTKFWITALVIGAFVTAMLLPNQAQAADTKDVIGALILGGIVGSQIQKGKGNSGTNTVILPNGATIITPSYKKDRENCYWILDSNGSPVYSSPICNIDRDTKYSWTPRYNKPYDSMERYNEVYPCGNYWGYKCGKLIKHLKNQ